MLTYGSLFTGAGGLEMGIQSVLPGRTLWHSDIDPGACKVLDHRWPDVPNLGDITAVDWTSVPRVDVLTGGSPCQDVSTSGARAGMHEGTRSNLWGAMREAIAVLHPSLVVWENVRGAYSACAASKMGSCPRCVGDDPGGRHAPRLRALGRVLGDLCDLRYDAQWYGLRAADVGAPHGRFRVFVFAWPAADTDGAGLRRFGRLHPERCDSDRCGRADRPGAHVEPAARGLTLLPTPKATNNETRSSSWANGPNLGEAVAAVFPGAVRADRWGDYAAAIARWERVIGRPAPEPTKPGRTGNPRLNPALVEWMMGWPPGHVTATPGVTDPQALRICGNGVVPQQAAAAARMWLAHHRQGDAA